ncbi:hypothetical protein N7501_009418 [Penicillium viridicatum]|nr:hypothetical protein N7501_009418 [Penicillium viridicatum]
MRLSVFLLALPFSLCAAKDSDRDSTAQLFNSTTAAIKDLPVFYEISDINLVETNHALDSFWAVNYIRTMDNRSFVVSANAIIRNGSATQRASIMSLDDSSTLFAKNYQSVGIVRENNGTLDPFNLTMPGGRFGLETMPHRVAAASSSEALSPMRIFSHLPEIEIDIDLEFQGPVILNAGLGSWLWAGGIQHQISLPAARPHGTIVVDNATLFIDSCRSVTWYDRQWGPTMPDHFTWFGLYLTAKDGLESYVSIWNWEDDINGNKSFATIMDQAGASTVLPLSSFQPSMKDLFHSKASGHAYALQHDITLMDGAHLVVKSSRPDQEFVIDNSRIGFYSGYVEVSGDYTGHGMVDIMPPV